MKKIYVLLVILVLIGAVFMVQKVFFTKIGPVACTMEAKMCSDGSYVGRTGPNCEFSACPESKATSTQATNKGYLVGHITLSPTCPVERVPPDPACAPKPYPALLDISGTDNFFAEVHGATDGSFSLTLEPGTYTLLIHQNTLYPRCDSKNVTITAGATSTTDISCDTGIR